MERLQQQVTQYYWSPQELALYDSAEKRHRDQISLVTQAEARGMQEGRQQGMREGMKKGRQQGMQEGIDLLVKKGLISKQAALEALKP